MAVRKSVTPASLFGKLLWLLKMFVLNREHLMH